MTLCICICIMYLPSLTTNQTKQPTNQPNQNFKRKKSILRYNTMAGFPILWCSNFFYISHIASDVLCRKWYVLRQFLDIIGKIVTNRLIQIGKCVALFEKGNTPVCPFKPFYKVIFAMGTPLIKSTKARRFYVNVDQLQINTMYRCGWPLGCTTKTCFFKNKISTTHHASAMGLIQGDPKGFLISTTFKGS